MGKLRAPFRLLGRRRNKKPTVGNKKQGKRGQGPSSVLTLQESESLQLALENERRSPQDKQIIEEQVSRFWGANEGAILGLGSFSRDCTMYFRDGSPTVNFEEERDNASLLLGLLREHELTEESLQAFEDRTSLLNESSFGGGPIVGDVMDPGDLGDDNDETSSSEFEEGSKMRVMSPDQSGMSSITRPTESDVVAELLQQEASQPTSPRYQNLPRDICGMKRLRDKLLAQKKASAQRRAEAKRIKQDLQRKEFKHHMLSTGLKTVVELSFEDERTIAGTGSVKSRSTGSVKSRSKPKSKPRPRPRPPAIRTLILDSEVYTLVKDDENPNCDMSRTASTGSSSGDPILEEVGSNAIGRPRPSAIKTLILDYEVSVRHHDKDDKNRECGMSRTASMGSSSGDPSSEEVGSNARPRPSSIKALILRYEGYHHDKD
jgi:hypothetical protein